MKTPVGSTYTLFKLAIKEFIIALIISFILFSIVQSSTTQVVKEIIISHKVTMIADLTFLN